MGMSNFRILLAVASAIVLFLYGLEGFSQEIQRLGGATLSKWLGRLTESRWRGLLLGAVATAIVQSSSAITSLTVALVVAGMLITAIIQSSSITMGLCILLVQQNLMSAAAAIPIVIGANIGTTATALVASIKMQKTARRVAMANLCFNTFGVLLFLPFLGMFAVRVVELAGDPGMAIAWSQLIFNVVMALAVLLLLQIFQRRLESIDASAAGGAASGA